MTDKPIISIPIDDSKFKEFLKLFDDFTGKLDDLPGSWEKVNEAVGETTGGFGKNVTGIKEMLAISMAQTHQIADAIKSATPAQERFRRATDQSTASMGKLHGQVSAVAEGVFSASSGLTGLKTVLRSLGAPGIIGAGALGAAFGLGDMALKSARSVSDTARSAFGANLGYGQYQNATAQLSPFIPNPGAMLQNIAAAQFNPAMYGMLSLYGVGANESPLSAAAKIVKGSVQALKSSHNALLPQVTFGESLTGLSETDLISLTRQNPQDLDAAIQKMLSAKLAAQQNVSGGVVSTDQRLVAGWSAALNTASAKFASAIAPLNPMVQDFGNDVAKFAGAVNSMVQAVVGPRNGSSANGGAGSPPAAIAASKAGFGAALNYALTGKGPSNIFPANADASITRKNNKGVWYNLTHPGSTLFGSPYDFSAPEKKYGLPHGLLRALGMDESSLNASAVSPKGALGMFQFMPDIAKSLGINPLDPGQSAYGAGYKMSGYLKKYNGNLSKAVAAYNWGPGNLDKDISAHGSNWQNYAPKETQGEIAKVLKLLAKQNSTAPKVSLNVSNSTSARVAMSANAAAFG